MCVCVCVLSFCLTDLHVDVHKPKHMHVVLCNTKKLVKHNMLSDMPFNTSANHEMPPPQP